MEISSNHSSLQPGFLTTSQEEKLAVSPNLDLEKFRAQFSPNITSEQMKTYVQDGNNLMNALRELSFSSEKWNAFIKDNASEDAAASLMWHFMKKAEEQGDLYTNGAIRIKGDDPDAGKKLEAFLKASGHSYPRISTHMKEDLKNLKILGLKAKQWGLDIGGLPAQKRTILFALQSDGSIFIKMEEHGCPPFWKKGFMSPKNIKEFLGHAFDFIRTRTEKIFGSKRIKGALPNRKEHVPEKIKKIFKKAIKELYKTSLKEKILEKMYLRESKATKKYREGEKFGITKMRKIVNEKKSQEEQIKESQTSQFLEETNVYIERAKKFNYIGDFKGNEVLLYFSRS